MRYTCETTHQHTTIVHATYPPYIKRRVYIYMSLKTMEGLIISAPLPRRNDVEPHSIYIENALILSSPAFTDVYSTFPRSLLDIKWMSTWHRPYT